ncbi:protein kinase family protein [Bacillaceae bacterium SIJ1]|uniref:protein kinase family protein n=1 Tax=Litoribacterium kuwaitense TaxID=1398745 RepID=UPI0013ED05C7|nr:protein kinase family protein [Litoribacterium kuwaitense]NGP45253.1 protein kinase family protein [Litoribacterium kuwaitense]
MKPTQQLVRSVLFKFEGKSWVVEQKDARLQLVGQGRSACVFRIAGTNRVLKVFYPPFVKIAQEEAEIYQQLAGISYFPTLHESGEGYLVIDYVEGFTFYTCMATGRRVTEAHIKEVDRALQGARERGLNPSDIHLQNLIVTLDGSVKLIDVARFRQKKKCQQWSHLKKAFYQLYQKRYVPKKWPVRVMRIVAELYKKKRLPRFR